nr:proline-rich protein 2-like [Chlorocebus sabaeus]
MAALPLYVLRAHAGLPPLLSSFRCLFRLLPLKFPPFPRPMIGQMPEPLTELSFDATHLVVGLPWIAGKSPPPGLCTGRTRCGFPFPQILRVRLLLLSTVLSWSLGYQSGPCPETETPRALTENPHVETAVHTLEQHSFGKAALPGVFSRDLLPRIAPRVPSAQAPGPPGRTREPPSSHWPAGGARAPRPESGSASGAAGSRLREGPLRLGGGYPRSRGQRRQRCPAGAWQGPGRPTVPPALLPSGDAPQGRPSGLRAGPRDWGASVGPASAPLPEARPGSGWDQRALPSPPRRGRPGPRLATGGGTWGTGPRVAWGGEPPPRPSERPPGVMINHTTAPRWPRQSPVPGAAPSPARVRRAIRAAAAPQPPPSSSGSARGGRSGSGRGDARTPRWRRPDTCSAPGEPQNSPFLCPGGAGKMCSPSPRPRRSLARRA